jgi:hypothetical protein
VTEFISDLTACIQDPLPIPFPELAIQEMAILYPPMGRGSLISGLPIILVSFLGASNRNKRSADRFALLRERASHHQARRKKRVFRRDEASLASTG